MTSAVHNLMSLGHVGSFRTLRRASCDLPLEMMTCERVLAVKVGARHLVVVARRVFESDKSRGEVVLYDASLDMVASDSWHGTCWDAARVRGEDGEPLLAAVGAQAEREGGEAALCLRLYSLDHGGLALRGSTTWKCDNAEWFEARAVAVVEGDDGADEIAVLALASGAKDSPERAQLRLYGIDLALHAKTNWEPAPGKLERSGGYAAVLRPARGRAQIVTAVNLNDRGRRCVELRTFDRELHPKRLASRLLRERHSASALAIAEPDGQPAIVVAGAAFPEPSLGAIAELLVFGPNLTQRRRTEWRTFRQSWVWDLMVADLDGDGTPQLITLGGTSMRGADERGAHMFSEMRVWDAALRPSDLFIWQSEPDVDTRASRGCLFPGRRPRLVVATSRWARQQPKQCEVRSFRHDSEVPGGRAFLEIARAWERKRRRILGTLLSAGDPALRALAIEALATRLHADSIPLIVPVLAARERPLVRRTVDVLRSFRSEQAVAAARGAGFATPDDWIVIGPFDNADGRGFDGVYPPERSFDANAFYAGQGAIARWSKVRQEHPDIYVDLAVSALLPFARTGVEISWNTRRTEAVAYALTDLHCPRRTKADIRLGRSDAARLWLNGREIWAKDDVRAPAVDDERIPVTLRAGRNRVMLKVANTKTNAWGFYFRITNGAGRPIRGLRCEAPQVASTEGDFLSRTELEKLLGDRDPALRALAAAELARSGEQAGIAALQRLAAGRNRQAAAQAALALVDLGEQGAADRLVALASGQPPTFRLEAAHALQRIRDRRWKRLSLERLRSKTGDPLGEFKLDSRGERGFTLKAILQGEEMGNIGVTCGHRLHFGDGVTASCSYIDVFGMTANKFRRRGIGAHIISRGCEIMDERGDACSVVGTGTGLVAHRLYRRMGYVDRWHSRNFHLALHEAPTVAGGDRAIRVRRSRASDRAALERLRRVYLDNSVGPGDDQRIRAWLRGLGPGVWVAACERKLVGCVDIAEDPYERSAMARGLCVASDADAIAVARSLFAAIIAALRVENFDRLVWLSPPERLRLSTRGLGFVPDPWGELHGWVAMFKVIRLPQLLNEIAPLLARRLQRSPLAGWEGTLALSGSRLRATLSVAGERVSARGGAARGADVLVTTSDDDITRLMAGYCDIWEAYRQHRLSTRPAFNERIWRLVECLFPMMDFRAYLA